MRGFVKKTLLLWSSPRVLRAIPYFFDVSLLCSSLFCCFSPVFVFWRYIGGHVEAMCRGNASRMNQKDASKLCIEAQDCKKRFRLLLFLIFSALLSLLLLLLCRKKEVFWEFWRLFFYCVFEFGCKNVFCMVFMVIFVFFEKRGFFKIFR